MWSTLCVLRVVTLLMPFSSSAQLTGSRGKGDGCGHMLLGPGSGTLTSRNYPGTYPNHTSCEWEIQVTEGKKIFLKFGDLDLQQCFSDYLKIFKRTSSSVTEHGTYCGNLNSISREIHIDSNEIRIQFKSGSHISGRGFLLSYTTSNYPDLITCLDKGNHYNEPRFSKNCPAGCKAVIGEVSGDFSQGYRHTSALCKAAIHAGVILDELGGKIDIVQHKGLSRYEGILANGVLSKDGSLSDKRIVFSTNDCNQPLGMELGHIAEHQINATSFWQRTDENGQVISWSPDKARLNVPGPGWAAAESGSQQWLQIDMGERKYLTGIITSGSTLPRFLFYVETYKVSFSKDGKKWKVYKEGNSNVERRWRQRIAIKVELIGCRQDRSFTGIKQKSIRHIDILEKEIVNNTDPIITKDINCGIRLVAIVVPIVLSVFLLILGIYIFKSLRNKKTEDSVGTPSQKAGCWEQFKQPFKRHQSTEFTISYSHEKEVLQKLDVVRSDSSDYQPSVMFGTVRVARKGSTFKPIDTEDDDGTIPTDSLNHYVVPLVKNQHEYAEPLTNQEPVYATPIIEKVQNLSYSTRKKPSTKETFVAVTCLTKLPLSSQVSSSHIEHNIPNGNGLHPSHVFYQIPQGITDSSKNGKAEYDQPVSNSTLIVGGFCGN
ncbi:discoidin, CUB and LCCL domain-containing protein 1 isoform X2 [Scyliorhinus canicula]|uniref:discoidin, CUB and LCCL domain-containing protein 1 isoform X2 n=1 Tax=Scyliorhinus canicula TaxID=7830 RepID=UPI0018F5853B|nr:discoidin, CUB and LCCL domain-containing protein 1 isoform X2 [Scyliorhinus canicula]